MHKIKVLDISKDVSDSLTAALTCVEANNTDLNTCEVVATEIANDAHLQVQANVWQPIHHHFEMLLETHFAGNKLLFKEKNVPEGPAGKGNVLSTVPATFLRLGLISEEEYTAFNQAIVNHPTIKSRLEQVTQNNSNAQQEIMNDYTQRLADIRKSRKK
jgi:hypothetical protein